MRFDTEKVTISKIMESKETKNFYKENSKNFFFDWFCKCGALTNRGKNLFAKLSKVVKANNGKFNPEETYVLFKNNCPCSGSLYDDFRICDVKTKDVIFTVVPSSGHNCDKGAAILYGRVNDFNDPLVVGDFEDILEYFRS